jgi:hypothetical protein
MTQETPKDSSIVSKDNRAIIDSELEAISKLIKLLSALDSGARDRVLSYSLQRLGMVVPPTRTDEFEGEGTLGRSRTRLEQPERGHIASSKIQDIRTFSEEKAPKSASERAAVVAYFLSEMALASERKDSINQDDITKYFKQAKFPLPGSPSMTLVNAKNSGYFEVEAPGQYRLNAVGYNLVAHRLPQDGDKGSNVKRKSGSKRAAKPSRAKKTKSKRG